MVNKKCHVFTPTHIVNKMLDEVGYIKELYGKSFLENSCGDGQIICEAVKRYINECITLQLSIEDIIFGLERDFFAIEFDAENFKNCKINLNQVLSNYGLGYVKWNIVNSDFLSFNIDRKFDFIVGNPPYISYANIDDENRKFIRENFNACKKGKFDYCYPFIEQSLNILSSSGKLAYLIPTNIFKNVFAKDLRNLLLNKIEKIIDYKAQKIFKNVLTSSSIIICSVNDTSPVIKYYDVSSDINLHIERATLGEKWMFDDKKNEKKIPFSEYFLAATSVATLLNEAFVIKEYDEKNDVIYVDDIPLEKELIRPAASPRALSRNEKEFIIFPYKYRGNKINRFEMDDIKTMYPGVINHLEKFREKLNARDSDSISKWFEYGRSQALENLNQKKLLMSFIVTNRVNVYELDEYIIPYSGIYIIRKSDLELSLAKEILESKEFLDYVKNIGIYVSGSSLRITANDIKNFDISKWRRK